MKKVIFIAFLFVTLQSALYAQKGLSEEGYKHWQKAIALMGEIKQESDYFLVCDEFGKVIETDATYADTYYNLAVLHTKMGDLGGGIPMFVAAKIYYDKYLALQPSEKNAILTELAQLEVKRESFIRNLKLDMVLIEGGEFKEKKNTVIIEQFYAQKNRFTIADYKRIITPMAIATVYSLRGKIFNIPFQQSSTGDDNIPYVLSYNTAKQIIEILNCITGKNYFLSTHNHLDLMEKDKRINFNRAYIDNGSYLNNSPYVIEWTNDCKKKDCYADGIWSIGGYKNLDFSRNSIAVASFRLVLPASEK